MSRVMSPPNLKFLRFPISSKWKTRHGTDRRKGEVQRIMRPPREGGLRNNLTLYVCVDPIKVRSQPAGMCHRASVTCVRLSFISTVYETWRWKWRVARSCIKHRSEHCWFI